MMEEIRPTITDDDVERAQKLRPEVRAFLYPHTLPPVIAPDQRLASHVHVVKYDSSGTLLDGEESQVYKTCDEFMDEILDKEDVHEGDYQMTGLHLLLMLDVSEAVKTPAQMALLTHRSYCLAKRLDEEAGECSSVVSFITKPMWRGNDGKHRTWVAFEVIVHDVKKVREDQDVMYLPVELASEMQDALAKCISPDPAVHALAQEEVAAVFSTHLTATPEHRFVHYHYSPGERVNGVASSLSGKRCGFRQSRHYQGSLVLDQDDLTPHPSHFEKEG
jgi:hypothetical protein